MPAAEDPGGVHQYVESAQVPGGEGDAVTHRTLVADIDCTRDELVFRDVGCGQRGCGEPIGRDVGPDHVRPLG